MILTNKAVVKYRLMECFFVWRLKNRVTTMRMEQMMRDTVERVAVEEHLLHVSQEEQKGSEART
jgi:hypothetical protein